MTAAPRIMVAPTAALVCVRHQSSWMLIDFSVLCVGLPGHALIQREDAFFSHGAVEAVEAALPDSARLHPA